MKVPSVLRPAGLCLRFDLIVKFRRWLFPCTDIHVVNLLIASAACKSPPDAVILPGTAVAKRSSQILYLRTFEHGKQLSPELTYPK